MGKFINKYIILHLLIIAFSFSHAQNEANTWHFGHYAGLDFNNGYPPVVLNVPHFTAANGSAAISDSLGIFLFSCGDFTIWNRNGVAMQNGNDINGWPGGSQYALILQNPGADNLYYVFTIGATDQQYQSGLWYSVVNMDLDNGNGAVTNEKNILLEDAWDARDKLIGFKGNNNDYKIIAYKSFSNEYAVFTLTEQGINNQPVISPSMTHNQDGEEANMKLSFNKKYLVSAFRSYSSTYEESFEICTYNKETDNIDFLYSIKHLMEDGGLYTEPHSVEFSPDSKLLYLCTYIHGLNSRMHLFQYDMRYIEDSVLFVASEILIDSGDMGGLQLARDGKIYLAWGENIVREDFLHIIHEPWKRGEDCNYEENALYMGVEKVNQFLPNMLLDHLYRFEYEGHCSSEPFYFKSNFIPEPSFIEWNFADPLSGSNISHDINPVHTFTSGGEFEVHVQVEYPNGRIEETSRVVTVVKSPQPDLGPDTLICAEGQIILNAGDEEGMYVWSNGTFGQNANEIIVSDTGWYWVQVTNNENCAQIDSIYIGLYPQSNINESNLTIIPTACGGSTGQIIGLTVTGEEPISFEWYDADSTLIGTTLDIEDLSVGNYFLHIQDGNSCINISDAYTIFDSGDIEVTGVQQANTHCGQSFGSIIISVNVGNTGDLFYSIDNGNNWQTGDPVFTSLSSGNYYVRVKDESGCEGVYEDNPVVIENINGPEIINATTTNETDYLANGQIDISAVAPQGQVHYSINNGTTFQTDNGLFTNLIAGTYNCIVKDDYGCDTTFTIDIYRIISQLIEAIAGDGNTCIGDVAVVPLRLNNFTDIFKFHVKLTYDTAILNCDGYINLHPELINNLQASIIPGTDEVIVSWEGVTPTTLEDNAVMLELVFGAKEEGLSGIDWAAAAGESAFYNENLDQINADYHVGALRVYTRPKIIMANEHDECEGEEFVAFPFITGGSGEVIYEWTGPDNFYSNNDLITIQNLGQQNEGIYTLIVTDTIDCMESKEVSLTVHENPQIAFSSYDTIYAEPSFILEAGSGYESYLWNTGDTTDAIQIFDEGLYSVFTTSTESCKSSDSVTILFSGEPFFMPNAFSPNGDGLNDVFKPVQRYDYVNSYHLSIYSRWGELIFETGDIEQGWDGSFKGKTAPQGTYVYRIVYTAHSTGTETQVKTGHFSLVK